MLMPFRFAYVDISLYVLSSKVIVFITFFSVKVDVTNVRLLAYAIKFIRKFRIGIGKEPRSFKFSDGHEGLFSPTDLTDLHRFSCLNADLHMLTENHLWKSVQSVGDFTLWSFFCPQISQIYTDLFLLE